MKYYALLLLLISLLSYQNCGKNFQITDAFIGELEGTNKDNSRVDPPTIILTGISLQNCDEVQPLSVLNTKTNLDSSCLNILFNNGQSPLGTPVTMGFDNFFEYKPQHSLYVYGASKRRWVYIPYNANIDNFSKLNWTYPLGTIFWKEFIVDGVVTELRRMIKVSNSGSTSQKWHFSTFVNQKLVDGDNIDETSPLKTPLANMSLQSQGLGVNHSTEGLIYQVPTNASVSQCSSCHMSGHDDGVLGFNSFQLSTDYSVNVDYLNSKELVSTLITADVPADDSNISVYATRAIGYLSTNCSSCHNLNGSMPSYGNFRHLGFSGSGDLTLTNNNVYKTFIDDGTGSPASLSCNLRPTDSNTIPAFEGMNRSSNPMPRITETARHNDLAGKKILGEWLIDLHNNQGGYTLNLNTYCAYIDSGNFFDPNLVSIIPAGLTPAACAQ